MVISFSPVSVEDLHVIILILYLAILVFAPLRVSVEDLHVIILILWWCYAPLLWDYVSVEDLHVIILILIITSSCNISLHVSVEDLHVIILILPTAPSSGSSWVCFSRRPACYNTDTLDFLFINQCDRSKILSYFSQ